MDGSPAYNLIWFLFALRIASKLLTDFIALLLWVPAYVSDLPPALFPGSLAHR